MSRRFGLAGGWAVAAVLTAASAMAQHPSPVTINPGGGGSAFGAGGININIPASAPTVINYPAYGYSGYNHGGYYGGYGYYGGLAVVAPGWSAPIPGVGGYGFSPGGYNVGYGPNGGAGISPYDQQLAAQQQYAMNASRYDLQTAQAAEAYQRANLYQQQALSMAVNNAKEQAALRQKFSVKTMEPKYSNAPAKVAPNVPLNDLLNDDGTPKWPGIAPKNDLRAQADSAIAAVAKDFRQDGQATVQDVNDARDALYAYGRPALATVRRQHASQGSSFKDFLNNLDVALDVMGQAPTTGPKPADPPK